MGKCTDSCTLRKDSRTNEIECFTHGTVEFSRQVTDAGDDPEVYNKLPYSDAFIYHAVKHGTTKNCSDVARELGLSPRTVAFIYEKHRRKVQE